VNYSQEGAYFVTIVNKDRQCHFGNVVGEAMQLSLIGRIAQECWAAIPKHFPHAIVDDFVIMPNHVYGIIILNECVGVQHVEPLRHKYQKIIPGSISTIVRSCKAAVTKACRENGWGHFQWQRNYLSREIALANRPAPKEELSHGMNEHIVRDDDDLNNITEYILNNPLQWSLDQENPDRALA